MPWQGVDLSRLATARTASGNSREVVPGKVTTSLDQGLG